MSMFDSLARRDTQQTTVPTSGLAGNSIFDGLVDSPTIYSGPPLPSNDPHQAVFNLERRLDRSGVTPPPAPRPRNLFLSALDYVDRPRNAIINMLEALQEGRGDVGGAFVRGLRREESARFENLLPEATTRGGRIARGAVGFVGDVLLDPLTYLSLGKTAVARGIGSRALASELKQGAVKTAVAKGANLVEDIHKFTGKDPRTAKMAIKGDDFSGAIKEAWQTQDEAATALKQLARERNRALRKMLPGISKDLRTFQPAQRLEYFTRLTQEAVGQTGHITSARTLQTMFPGLTLDTAKAMRGLNKGQLEAIKIYEEIAKTNVRRVSQVKDASQWLNQKTNFSRMQRIASDEAAIGAKAAQAFTQVEYLNGLAELVDAAGRTKFVTFMGLPIFDFSSLVAPVGRAVQAAYYLTPGVTRAVDTASGLFKTEYIRRSLTQMPEQYKELQKVAREVTRYLRLETGVPHQALYDASKVFDKELLTDKNLQLATSFFIQRNNDDIARAHWAKWDATLTADEKLVVAKAAKAYDHYMSAINSFDESMGVVYDAKQTYLHQLYTGKIGIPTQAVEDIAVAPRVQQLTKKGRVGQRLSHDPTMAYPQKYTSIAMAKEKYGMVPVENIVVNAALRSMSSQRLALNKQLTRELSRFTRVVAKRGTPAAAGMQDVVIPKFNELAAHPEVIRQLNRLDSLFFNDEATQSALGYLDQITNTLKTLQTSANVTFLANNFIGEILMNLLADVSVTSHARAMSILLAIPRQRMVKTGETVIIDGTTFAKKNAAGAVEFFDSTGAKTAEVATKQPFDEVVRERLIKDGAEVFNVGGKDYLPYELMKTFRDIGLGWSGIAKGDIVQNMDALLRQELPPGTAVEKVRRMLPWNLGKDVGDFTETFARLAHMIDRLDKGWGLAAIGEDVRKFHVDYRNLTKFESNWMRRIMPFYTYMRHNTPIALRLLFEQPGFYGALGRISRYAHEDLGNPETADYLQRNAAIPLMRDAVGNIRYVNINLPLVDAGRITFDMQDAVQRNLLNMLHPGLKGPFELAANQHFGLGVPIEQFEGERKHLFPGGKRDEGYGPQLASWKDYALRQTGFIDATRRAIGAGLDAAHGVEKSLDEQIMRPTQIPYLRGVLPLRSPRHASDIRAYKRRDQLLDHIKKLEQQEQHVISADTYQRMLRTGEMGGSMFDSLVSPGNNRPTVDDSQKDKPAHGLW